MAVVAPFLHSRDVLFASLVVKELQNLIQVFVSLQSCLVVLVHHQVLYQETELRALLGGERNAELPVVSLGLLVLHSL